ncbi:hypothetical protein BAE36_24845 [Rhizobium leguminosarum bv. trifolii]|jgi:hypothetical protein|uniref:Uncharacterized protein n=1 Tax=Rhizobium leguminosarum bv. trifolii TaxID=386 RepID=A0A1B8R6L2_RHILT|nr:MULTISPECIES: hypothetical protein [Rhizobium]WSH59848.1 hypothetical protein U8P68_11020 [Rhizobium ruizarguesonis]AOO92614.1 hypothetical protein [Rhizobium leguminosarum bv. trifolii]OBY04443.1 hypothetical protein BAE36_24845 [Rhizobium leguminosarum bv. trifolii]TBE54493.1 hypothetical protein ELH04_08760 [Rhizobium leguminosarum]WSG87309.1 hypothetical protein U8P73_14730 [Rhizobium beringeri]
MREQSIGEAVEDDEWVPDGVMWPPETEIDVSEVHESLLKAMAGGRAVRFFRTHLIDVPTDCCLGGVQMAIDEVAGEACGIYLTVDIAGFDPETRDPILVDEATKPFRFSCTGDVEKAIATLSENLRAEGLIR